MNSDTKEHDEHATPHGLSSAESAMHQRLVMTNLLMMNMQQEIPEGATHVRYEDQFYKVTNKVQYFVCGAWNDAIDCFDLEVWLNEIKPIKKS